MVVVVTHRPMMCAIFHQPDLPPSNTRGMRQKNQGQTLIDIFLTWFIQHEESMSLFTDGRHTHTHTTELAKSKRCSFVVCSITLGLKWNLQLNKNYICSPLFEPLNLELWHVNIFHENQSGQIDTHTRTHTDWLLNKKRFSNTKTQETSLQHRLVNADLLHMIL